MHEQLAELFNCAVQVVADVFAEQGGSIHFRHRYKHPTAFGSHGSSKVGAVSEALQQHGFGDTDALAFNFVEAVFQRSSSHAEHGGAGGVAAVGRLCHRADGLIDGARRHRLSLPAECLIP